MRKKTVILCLVLLIMALSVCMSGCSGDDAPPLAAEDEIKLIIQLDVKEDIGLLILDQNVNGDERSGGISNADKSMLKHDDMLDWSYHKNGIELGGVEIPGNTVDLSLRFRVITEYCEPNYESIYPEEYTVLLDPISFDADFGKTYHITITGDKESGHQAGLDEP